MNHPLRRVLVPFCVVGVVLLVGVAWWLRQSRAASALRPVYVALGASDAVGVGADDPERDGWVPQVWNGLPNGTKLLNLGIDGATTSEVLSQEVPVALDARPRWVTLWPGINDLRDGVSLSDFSAALNRVLDQVSHVPDATLVVLNIPDLRSIPAFAGSDPAELDATVRQWNAAIAEAAARHGALLIDLYRRAPELASNPQYVSSDGFHPSSLGYRRIAELVLEALHERPAANHP